MKLLVLLATLGCALALQSPVQYTYEYEARVGTGMHTSRPFFAGTGIRARVTLTLQEPGVATVQMTDVKVGTSKNELTNNGRSSLPIDYQPIQDKALELPFKGYLKRQNKETVMEVPETDLLWVTNIRRGVVNSFRLAPLLDPSSVKPAPNGESIVPPETFSRMEDTFAGRCRVIYTITPKPKNERVPSVQPDIQSKSSQRGPAGRQIQLEEQYYRLVSSIDFSTCIDRVQFLQTGVANLTNVTDSYYREVASRSFIMKHTLKGSPGSFRVEDGVLESIYLFNPYGIDSEKMVIVSNQTLKLVSASPVSSHAGRVASGLKQVKTWQHQVQSPNKKSESGFAPDYIIYKEETSEKPHSPIFYERMVTGFGHTKEKQNEIKEEIYSELKKASQQLSAENQLAEEEVYGGTKDGLIAQRLHQVQKLIRTLPMEKLEEIHEQVKRDSSDCQVCHDLYVDLLRSAGSGPSLELLFKKIAQGDVSLNRTATIFYYLGNNIQSPEALKQMIATVKTSRILENPIVAILAKINVALAIRRLCVSPQITPYSSFQYIFGAKTCNKHEILSEFIPVIFQNTRSESSWEKIVSIYSAAALGFEGLVENLGDIAMGVENDDVVVRLSAVHALSGANYDNVTYPKLHNYLLPIAENQREDYRIRQRAYLSILSTSPNATMIQRMAESAMDEPSTQMRTFVYWMLLDLSKTTDPQYKVQSNIAKNLLPLFRYINPSKQRNQQLSVSEYLPEELVGGTIFQAYVTSLTSNYPMQSYNSLNAKFGGMDIPFLENNFMSNSNSPWSYIDTLFEQISKKNPEPSQRLREQRRRTQEKITQSGVPPAFSAEEPIVYYFIRQFMTSEVILPMNDVYMEQYTRQASEVMRRFADGQKRQLVSYSNPVEINMIIPTPTGLFSLTEVNAPTVLSADVKGQFLRKPFITEDGTLPEMPLLNISADGIIKTISKVNTYSYVVAPWLNQTVLAGVDNEKSFSLPMKIEVGISYKRPDQLVWCQITPKIQDQQRKVPVAMVRNIPFVSTGPVLVSPVPDSRYKMDKPMKVYWLSTDEKRADVTIPVSQSMTGLNAEIKYQGETYNPLAQVNYIEYLQKPSRLFTLLASPSIKGYNMTLYKLPGQSQVQNIGFHFRHVIRNGTGSPITYPASAKSVVDLDPSEPLQQRIQKISQFSNVENHEVSLMVNFTSSSQQQQRVYELNLLRSYDDRPQSSEIHDTFRKYQVSFLKKYPEQGTEGLKPKTALVVVIDRPIPQPLAEVEQQFADGSESLFRQLSTGIAADVYEGQALSPGSPVAQCLANLSVSPLQGSYIQNLANEQTAFPSPLEVYRLAVYDRLDMEVRYQFDSFSRGLQNVTYKSQDLAQGFLFPTLLTNHFATNQPNTLKVQANRTVSDDRITAWVQLPQKTVQVRGPKVYKVFDWITGYTGQIFVQQDQQQRKMYMSANGPIKSCIVQSNQVKTYDGISYQKQPLLCETVVTKLSTPQENLVVLAQEKSSSPSSEQKVRILDAAKGIDVELDGARVKVQGQELQQGSKVLRSEAGEVVAKITKVQGLSKVELPSKMKLALKDGRHLAIEMDPRHKNSVRGLCGDFNADSVEELQGPSACVYRPVQGKLYAADWIAQKSQCQDQTAKQLLRDVSHHEQSCQKTRRLTVSAGGSGECKLEAYRIRSNQGSYPYCLDTIKTVVCVSGCHRSGHVNTPIRAKCWSRDQVPSEIRSNAVKGYITKDVQTPATEYVMIQHPDVPSDCYPNSHQRVPLYYPQPPHSDLKCILPQSQYPLRQIEALMCVSIQPRRVCSSECASQDTQLHHLLSNCWNLENTPQEVMNRRQAGYIPQQPSQQPEFVQMVHYDMPSYCYEPTPIQQNTASHTSPRRY